MVARTTTWSYEESMQTFNRLERTINRKWVEWGGRHYKPLHIQLNGNYVAKRDMNTLIIAELSDAVGAGNMTSNAQFDNAIPVVAVHFNSIASIEGIRKWLDAMEKAVTPTWQYKDGD